jgi:hypothetical protein
MIATLATLAIWAVILGGLVWIRRSGRGSSFMQPFDEIWHPAAHQARIEVAVQQERPAPSPLPGDRLL